MSYVNLVKYQQMSSICDRYLGSGRRDNAVDLSVLIDRVCQIVSARADQYSCMPFLCFRTNLTTGGELEFTLFSRSIGFIKFFYAKLL